MKVKTTTNPLVKIAASVVGVLLALAAIVVAIYFYLQYQKTQLLLTNPSKAAQEETKELIAKVGKLIELPSGEPTIATVADSQKLKNQAFFAKARNGDKVLIYTTAKKAILYRPSTNKIIDVAPVNIDANQPVIGAQTESATPSAALRPSTSPSPTVELNYTVAIYNGTTVKGLANTFEQQLKEKAPQYKVVTKANAKKQDYTKTIVVDLKGNKAKADELAKLVSGSVAKLPEGETSLDADFLIIVSEN